MTHTYIHTYTHMYVYVYICLKIKIPLVVLSGGFGKKGMNVRDSVWVLSFRLAKEMLSSGLLVQSTSFRLENYTRMCLLCSPAGPRTIPSNCGGLI